MPFLGNGDCTITEAMEGDVSSLANGGNQSLLGCNVLSRRLFRYCEVCERGEGPGRSFDCHRPVFYRTFYT
jgi:hypothetical protein